jgi:hypothetical protein
MRFVIKATTRMMVNVAGVMISSWTPIAPPPAPEGPWC